MKILIFAFLVLVFFPFLMIQSFSVGEEETLGVDLKNYSEIIITAVSGSSVPGCEDIANGCYAPTSSIANVGEKILFSNMDDAAHTFTSGNVQNGPNGIFDSSLISPGDSYEWIPKIVNEYPYFCMVHPWMIGLIIVEGIEEETQVVEEETQVVEEETQGNLTLIKKISTDAPNSPARNSYGVAVSMDGRVYVADAGNDDIRIYDKEGNFISKFGGACHIEGYTPVKRIDKSLTCFDPDGDGPLDIGDGQFDRLYGIAMDKNDTLFVADTDNHRMQVFDSDGNFLFKFGTYCKMSDGSNCFDPDGDGPLEIGDGQMYYSYSLKIDNQDRVIVADRDNHRIQVFDSDGNFLFKFGQPGSNPGEFNAPYDVAVDSIGKIYVADAFNKRIQVFDSDGKFIKQFGAEGNGNGEFNVPISVATDSKDNLFVSDVFNHRIQVFDSDGKFLNKFGSLGPNDGQFHTPRQIIVDNKDQLYVIDRQNSRVQVFTYTDNPPIDIKLNKEIYENGDLVKISGEIKNYKKEYSTSLEIKEYFGKTVLNEEIPINKDGKFSVSFEIPLNKNVTSYNLYLYTGSIGNEISASNTIFMKNLSSDNTDAEQSTDIISKIIKKIKSVWYSIKNYFNN